MIRFLALAAGAGLVVAVIMFGCSDDESDDDDDAAAATTDSCGYKLANPPEGCDACHGMPPQTARHPDNPRCYRCHGYVVDEAFNFVQPDLHRNGEVDYAVGCASCHGWSLGVSPPQDLSGECTQGESGTGAHAKMRRTENPANNMNCSNCHVVPLGVWDASHIDGDGRAEITFGLLATADGAEPQWDGKTCSGVYCHGATLAGGDLKEPSWFDTSGAPSRCGACHRLTDPNGNANADCHSCHPTSLDADRKILPFGTHINGAVDMTEDAR